MRAAAAAFGGRQALAPFELTAADRQTRRAGRRVSRREVDFTWASLSRALRDAYGWIRS